MKAQFKFLLKKFFQLYGLANDLLKSHPAFQVNNSCTPITGTVYEGAAEKQNTKTKTF